MASITFTTDQGTEIALSNIQSAFAIEAVRALIPFVEGVENAQAAGVEYELVHPVNHMPLPTGGQLIWDPYLDSAPDGTTVPVDEDQLFSCGAPECEGQTAEELHALNALVDEDDGDEDDLEDQLADLLAETVSDCEASEQEEANVAGEFEEELLNEAYGKSEPTIYVVKGLIENVTREDASLSILGLSEYLKQFAALELEPRHPAQDGVIGIGAGIAIGQPWLNSAKGDRRCANGDQSSQTLRKANLSCRAQPRERDRQTGTEGEDSFLAG